MQIQEQSIDIRTGAGNVDGFFYSPAGSGSWPGVIHLTDIVGIRPSNREMARRLAGIGYCVLQPNAFYRTSKLPVFDFKPNFAEEKTTNRLAELRAPLTTEAIASDAAAYADSLAAQPGVKKGAFGIVGYCFTGAMALRAAATLPERIAAAASFHGGSLATDAPTSPHTLLPRVRARLYFGHADNDRSMPKEAIEKLEAALRAWGGKYESETYAGAGHGWTVPDSPAYNEPQAERAFKKLSELFATALK
jgi:carboxymethylenebutenolidase